MSKDRGFNPAYRGNPRRTATVRVVSYLLVVFIALGGIVAMALQASADHRPPWVRHDHVHSAEHKRDDATLRAHLEVHKKAWCRSHQRDRRCEEYRPRPSRSSRYGHLNWRALAECETGNRNIHNPSGRYHGYFQFDLQTWRSVGMSGDPHNYGWATQLEGAKRLYASRGRSPWPHCGSRL